MIRDSILGTEQTQYVSIQQTLIHSFIMCMELHTNSIEVLFVQSMYDVSARTERVLCVPPNHYPWHIRILHSENDLLWPKNHVFECENVLSSNVAQSRTTNFIWLWVVRPICLLAPSKLIFNQLTSIRQSITRICSRTTRSKTMKTVPFDRPHSIAMATLSKCILLDFIWSGLTRYIYEHQQRAGCLENGSCGQFMQWLVSCR